MGLSGRAEAMVLSLAHEMDPEGDIVVRVTAGDGGKRQRVKPNPCRYIYYSTQTCGRRITRVGELEMASSRIVHSLKSCKNAGGTPNCSICERPFSHQQHSFHI